VASLLRDSEARLTCLLQVRCDYRKSAELSERADALEDVLGNDARSAANPRLLLEAVPQIDATREDVRISMARPHLLLMSSFVYSLSVA
jgi:hypothetical protein